MEDLLYHYTSLDALRSILGKEICLWATHYLHLNDPSEQIWAEKYVLEAIKRDSDYTNDSNEEFKAWFEKQAYILSLCKKGDDRNMWRLYCDDGKGVCLVLDRNLLSNYCLQLTNNNPKDNYCILEEVEYATANNVGDAFENCKRKPCFYIANEEKENQLMRIIPFIKNADFNIESEVRCAIEREVDVISFPYDKSTGGPGKPTFHMNDNNCKYRMRGNELIPYIEVRLPVAVLKGIILGYEVSEQEAKDFITKIIENCGAEYKGLIIEKSRLFSKSNQKRYGI